MRNHFLSYPKSGKNRIELLCLLYLTRYIGTASPLGWFWLKYWCKFTHFGYHNINIPDFPSLSSPLIEFPKGSTINIFRRDPIAILYSTYRWYKQHPPEAPDFKNHMDDGMTLEEFAVSDWGIKRLEEGGIRLQQLADVALEREYRLRFYQYEETFDWNFVQLCIPEILNLRFRLDEEECKEIIKESSVAYVKELLSMTKLPEGITPDLVAGLKIGMAGGHIQIGDPKGHVGVMAPDVEVMIRSRVKGTLL